jgi:integrase
VIHYKNISDIAMPLTDAKVRNAKPEDKDYKLADMGGLYLLVKKNGAKLWRLKYRLAGKEKLYAIGQYPQVSLSAAREARDNAKLLIAEGRSPVTVRQTEKLEVIEQGLSTFEAVAREFYEKVRLQGKETTAFQSIRLLELYGFPKFGPLPLASIKPIVILNIMKQLEARGIANTASRFRHVCGQVFRYGVATLRCDIDPTASIKRAIVAPPVKHHQAAEDPPALWRKILTYRGTGTTRIALQLLMLLAVRTNELRRMEKSELDLDKKLWTIPAAKMKKRRTHTVPLPDQAVALIQTAIDWSGDSQYVFPNQRTPGEAMSEATLRKVMIALEAPTSPHGLRATFSTHLHSQGYPSHLIEMQLAHAEENKMKATYNHAQYLDERRRLMERWADFVTGEG